jgi:mRNA-degrading endonuclease RelE of RelBE toxin-antitoxin system
MIPICDHSGIADPPSFSDVRARLAALRNQGGVRGEIAPAGGATPEQLDAMRESAEILSDPKMAVRVRAGRQAVASGDVVPLEESPGDRPATPGEWRVALTGPVARELEQSGELSSTPVRELLRALAARPDERGRALGMGLVGVWSAHVESQRVLYAMHEEQRLVTVLSIDDR